MSECEVVMLLVHLEILVRFLMVCEEVGIIGIRNIVNLSLKGSLYILVGREMGL